MIKNGGFVLRGEGRLPGVMAVPKDVQQFLVGDDGWVEIDLDGLGVIAETVIRGIFPGAARVSYPGANYAVDGPELGIRSPKSAQGEGGSFGLGGNCGIHGWNLAGWG